MLTKEDLEQLRIVVREEIKQEIKLQVDPLHERFEVQNKKISALDAKIDHVQSTLDTKIDKVQKTLETKIDHVQSTLDTKIDNIQSTLDTKIDKVQESVDIVQEVMVNHFGKLDTRVTKIEEHLNLPHSKH